MALICGPCMNGVTSCPSNYGECSFAICFGCAHSYKDKLKDGMPGGHKGSDQKCRNCDCPEHTNACPGCVPAFNELAAMELTTAEVRRIYPRFNGHCDVCQYSGVKYASYMHYICGDW